MFTLLVEQVSVSILCVFKNFNWQGSMCELNKTNIECFSLMPRCKIWFFHFTWLTSSNGIVHTSPVIIYASTQFYMYISVYKKWWYFLSGGEPGYRAASILHSIPLHQGEPGQGMEYRERYTRRCVLQCGQTRDTHCRVLCVWRRGTLQLRVGAAWWGMLWCISVTFGLGVVHPRLFSEMVWNRLVTSVLPFYQFLAIPSRAQFGRAA